MSAMLRITTVKANTFTTAARTPAMKNAVAVKGWASRRVTAPDGSGRFGRLTRSVSRSYRSFRAFPPAVKDAAAAPASASGPANAPQAPDRAATTPPIPTPRADITQLIGRASRRRPAIFGARYGATRTNRCPFTISRMTGRPPDRRNGLHRNTYLRSSQCIPSPIGFRDGFSRSRERPARFSDRGNHMFDDKGPGIGFLKTTRARHAEEAIGLTEGLVTVLRLTQADIKPAEDALTVAKGFFDAHQYAKAIKEGRAFQEKAQIASNQIFVAELAIESVANLRVGGGEPGSEAFAHGAVSSLETALHDATKELALGNAEGAATIARELEERARSLKSQFGIATTGLKEIDGKLADLRSEGVLTVSVELQAKMARDLLDRGLIEPAAAMAARLHAETKSLGDQYRKATTTLSDAEILYSRLQREGFHSYEADAALRDARRCLREGSYGRSIHHLERALQAFARRTNARASLAKAIEETRTRVKLLAGGGLSFMPDIQEVLGRAERELQQGNYAGSSEDLRIATVLLDGVTRAPEKK